MNLLALTSVAISAAKAAGTIITDSRLVEKEVQHKTGGSSYASQVFTEVDKACEEAILSYLRPTCEGDNLALITEETADDGSRLTKDYFWCVDPLDGTLAYINGYAGYAVSIALVAQDGSPVIGVVYDPSRDVVYHAIKGKGVYKNSEPWHIVNTNAHFTYVTDRPLATTPHAAQIKAFLSEQLSMTGTTRLEEMSGAGAVLNAIRVLENGPACMVKLPKAEQGGGSLWDYAATACIYHELGLKATKYSGGPLDLNRADSTYMNHEGVCFVNL